RCELETLKRRATCEGAGHEQGTIYWVGCPHGYDRRCGGRTGGRGAVAGGDSQSAGIDPEAGEETRRGQVAANLLRGRSDRVCDLLAAHRSWRGLGGRGPAAGPGEGGRPREARP